MAVDSHVSIHDEIARIRKASAARDPWAVLGIPPKSAYKQIKIAHRKWIRKLHPDRWYASGDDQLRKEVTEAFYQVQAAYSKALEHSAAGTPGHASRNPITSPAGEPNKSVNKPGWFQRLMSFFFSSNSLTAA